MFGRKKVLMQEKRRGEVPSLFYYVIFIVDIRFIKYCHFMHQKSQALYLFDTVRWLDCDGKAIPFPGTYYYCIIFIFFVNHRTITSSPTLMLGIVSGILFVKSFWSTLSLLYIGRFLVTPIGLNKSLSSYVMSLHIENFL